MNEAVRCPRCGQEVRNQKGCRHLRWVPSRGGPTDFARHVLQTSPCQVGHGFGAGSVSAQWWELQEEWLLERISTRLDVIDGFCFGDPVELDRLFLDIWHRFSPPEERPVTR